LWSQPFRVLLGASHYPHFVIVKIKTDVPDHYWRQPITSIVDCQLPIVDCRMPIADYGQARNRELTDKRKSPIGNRQSAIGLTPFSRPSYSAEKVGVVRFRQAARQTRCSLKLNK
ncbi:MAG TPA: hypothetical protein VLB87_07080, partial [Pyrinomonadaceae bacterium]|nr:hypothetical protein [Pyrinomonadaceae bacterium]